MESELSALAIPLWQYSFWSKVTATSVTSLLVYDYLSTIREEVEFYSYTKWSLGRIVFVVVRYHGLWATIFNLISLFVPPPTSKFCLGWTWWQWTVALFLVWITESLLVARIYAMYGLNRRLLHLLVALFLASWLSAFAIMLLSQIRTDSQLKFVPALPDIFAHRLRGCFPSGSYGHPAGANDLYLFWIPSLCFEGVLCGMVLWKAVTDYNILDFDRPRVSGEDLIVRDSVVYFLAAFAAYLTNCLVWRYGDARMGEVTVGFTVAVPTITIQRLLLHMQQYICVEGSTKGRTFNLTAFISQELYHLDWPVRYSNEADRASSQAPC